MRCATDSVVQNLLLKFVLQGSLRHSSLYITEQGMPVLGRGSHRRHLVHFVESHEQAKQTSCAACSVDHDIIDDASVA